MARPCMEPGCPELVSGRASRCPAHQPAPFANSSRLDATWPRQRRRALRRDGNRCVVCGEPASEVDHRVPRVYGGTDHLDNLRSLCRACHMISTQAVANAVKRGMKRYADPHEGA